VLVFNNIFMLRILLFSIYYLLWIGTFFGRGRDGKYYLFKLTIEEYSLKHFDVTQVSFFLSTLYPRINCKEPLFTSILKMFCYRTILQNNEFLYVRGWIAGSDIIISHDIKSMNPALTRNIECCAKKKCFLFSIYYSMLT
jgi:hypothetical protein